MNYYIIVYNLDKCNSDNYINVCEIKYSNAKTLCMDPPFILSFLFGPNIQNTWHFCGSTVLFFWLGLYLAAYFSCSRLQEISAHGKFGSRWGRVDSGSNDFFSPLHLNQTEITSLKWSQTVLCACEWNCGVLTCIKEEYIEGSIHALNPACMKVF